MIVLFQILTGDAWETPFFDAMRVEEVPQALTVLFFVLYFLISNLIMLNLFIAAILERLKVSAKGEASVSQAARAALVMKESLEAEAAKRDLDNARLFLQELVKYGVGDAADLLEATETIKRLEEVNAKEAEEAEETESMLSFFGCASTRYTLGIFGTSNRFRQMMQIVVDHWLYNAFVWLVAFCAAIVPCFKGQVSDFDDLDNMLTVVFGSLMIVEILIKSIADGFLWVVPSIREIKQHTVTNNAKVAPSSALAPSPDSKTQHRSSLAGSQELDLQHTTQPPLGEQEASCELQSHESGAVKNEQIEPESLHGVTPFENAASKSSKITWKHVGGSGASRSELGAGVGTGLTVEPDSEGLSSAASDLQENWKTDADLNDSNNPLESGIMRSMSNEVLSAARLANPLTAMASLGKSVKTKDGAQIKRKKIDNLQEIKKKYAAADQVLYRLHLTENDGLPCAGRRWRC